MPQISRSRVRRGSFVTITHDETPWGFETYSVPTSQQQPSYSSTVMTSEKRMTEDEANRWIVDFEKIISELESQLGETTLNADTITGAIDLGRVFVTEFSNAIAKREQRDLRWMASNAERVYARLVRMLNMLTEARSL